MSEEQIEELRQENESLMYLITQQHDNMLILLKERTWLKWCEFQVTYVCLN